MTVSMAPLLFLTLISAVVALPVAFILEKRRLRSAPGTRPYSWGLFLGVASAIFGGALMGAALASVAKSVSALWWALVGGLYLCLGVGVVRRSAAAWVVLNAVSLNPVLWVSGWIYGRNRWEEFRGNNSILSPSHGASTEKDARFGFGAWTVAVVAILAACITAVGVASQSGRRVRSPDLSYLQGLDTVASPIILQPVLEELRQSRSCRLIKELKVQTCSYQIGTGIRFRHNTGGSSAIPVDRVTDSERLILFHPMGDCLAVIAFHLADSTTSVAYLSNSTGGIKPGGACKGDIRDWTLVAKSIALSPKSNPYSSGLPFDYLRQTRVCSGQVCRFSFEEKQFAITGIGTNNPTFSFLAADSTPDSHIWLDIETNCVVVLHADFGQGRPNKFFEAYVSSRDGRVYRENGECAR